MYLISSLVYLYKEQFINLNAAKEKAATIKDCDILIIFRSGKDVARIVCLYSNGELLYEKPH